MRRQEDGSPLAMTLGEASDALQLDRRVVVEMLRAGEIRGNRTRGGVWRIDRASVVAWLRGEVGSAPAATARAGGTR